MYVPLGIPLGFILVLSKYLVGSEGPWIYIKDQVKVNNITDLYKKFTAHIGNF